MKKISLHMGSLSFHTKYVEDILPSQEEISTCVIDGDSTGCCAGICRMIPRADLLESAAPSKVRCLYNATFGHHGNKAMEAVRLEVMPDFWLNRSQAEPEIPSSA